MVVVGCWSLRWSFGDDAKERKTSMSIMCDGFDEVEPRERRFMTTAFSLVTSKTLRGGHAT